MARPTRAFDQCAALFARPVADTGICAPADMAAVVTALWLRSTTGLGRTLLPIRIIPMCCDPIVLPWPTDKKAGIHSVTNVINEIAASP